MGGAVLFCWALGLGLGPAAGDKHEHQLYEDLQKNYSPLERPVENNSLPVQVNLGVILQQIVDLDEKNQIIQVNVWLKYTWRDHKLRWEPREYGGVTDVRFPVGRIWKPDVLLYNSADPNFDSTYPSNLLVYSDGTVNWIPPGILKSSCKIDITWFPFDDQSCYLKFGSWTYHGFALDLQPESLGGMDVSEYLTNGEWSLLSAPVNRSEKYYDCCPEPYPDLKFFLNIRRRTLYYGFNLIIPSLLISLMTVLGFTLPPDAGEKITLEITILLSVCFFLSIVADMSPPTSEAVPLIGTFFSCCMLVVSASVVFTVVVLNLHYRTPDTHEMSPFVRSVLLNWLPWLLMMKRPGHAFVRTSVLRAFQGHDETSADSANARRAHSESLLRNIRCLEEVTNPHLPPPPPPPPTYESRNGALGGGLGGALGGGLGGLATGLGGGLGMASAMARSTVLAKHIATHRKESQDLEQKVNRCLRPLLEAPGAVDTGLHALILQLQRIHMELKFVTRRMEKEDEDEDAENDWKFAAMVVDRLCLVIFSLFIIASTCGIMFSAPNLRL